MDVMIYLFLLLTGITSWTWGSKGTALIHERISEVIDVFCPGVNVCRENRSHNNSSVTFKHVFWSCCTECHCRDNCTEDNTCCFPPKQPTITNGNGTQIGKKCLFPTTVQRNDVHPSYYKSFNMVTSVTNAMKIGQAMDPRISCGDEIVAPWGSLFPLYSPIKEAIYKNKVCAEAHGVTDGIIWDAVLDCDIAMTKMKSAFPLYSLHKVFFPLGCSVNFIPPIETKDMKAFQCYDFLINTCSETAFQQLNEAGLSKIDIINMCESGFLSPFMGQYANVFCYICNQKKLLASALFCNDSIDLDRVSGAPGFFGLIDNTLIDPNNGQLIVQKYSPVVCDSKDARRCRTVLCPSLQLRDKSGKCRYLTKLWFNQKYTVYINLSLERNIGFDEIDDIINMLSGLTQSVGKWRIESISVEINDKTKHIRSLLVIVTYKTSKIRPQYLMQKVRKIFSLQWRLHLKNDTLLLKSSFSKVLNIYDEHVNHLPFKNVSTMMLPPIYYELYRDGMNPEGTHDITKLYICEQVEISSSEFTFQAEETYIFIIKTQKVLFDAEFLFYSSNDGSGKNARICYEDAGMFKIKNGSLRMTAVLRIHYFILFVTLLTSFWTL